MTRSVVPRQFCPLAILMKRSRKRAPALGESHTEKQFVAILPRKSLMLLSCKVPARSPYPRSDREACIVVRLDRGT